MSGRKVQGAFYVYPLVQPIPVGFISAPELLNDLLPVWWGERAHLGPTALFGHEAGDGTDLGTLEKDGQILGTTGKIIDDAQSRSIKFFVASEGSDPLSLGFGFWQAADPLLLRDSLCTGTVCAGRDGPAPWAEGKALILRREDAEAWLDQIQSPHVLPDDPLTRNSLELPEKDKVSLCELVTWLADGKALQSEDDAAQSKAREAKITELLDRHSAALSSERLSPDAIWTDRDYRSLSRLVAEELARQVRVRDVNVAIVETMRSEKIRGYADGASGSGRREPIPSQELPEPLPSNFVFERDDLIRLWGDVADGNSSGPARGMDADPTILPRFSRAEAEAAYQKRVKDWPADAPPPSRDDDAIWFKAEFGASRAFAREMRRTHAPTEWRSHGRRQTGRN